MRVVKKPTTGKTIDNGSLDKVFVSDDSTKYKMCCPPGLLNAACRGDGIKQRTNQLTLMVFLLGTLN